MNVTRWWFDTLPGTGRLGLVIEYDADAAPCPIAPPETVTTWLGAPTLIYARPHSSAAVYIDRTTTARPVEYTPPAPKRKRRKADARKPTAGQLPLFGEAS